MGSTVEKKIWGRKRHLLVDTQGLILAVLVHAANIGDREGARLLLQALVGRFPRLIHLFADHGYTGPRKASGSKTSWAGTSKSFPKRAMSRIKNGSWWTANPFCRFSPKVAFRSNVTVGKSSVRLAG